MQVELDGPEIALIRKALRELERACLRSMSVAVGDVPGLVQVRVGVAVMGHRLTPWDDTFTAGGLENFFSYPENVGRTFKVETVPVDV